MQPTQLHLFENLISRVGEFCPELIEAAHLSEQEGEHYELAKLCVNAATLLDLDTLSRANTATAVRIIDIEVGFFADAGMVALVVNGNADWYEVDVTKLRGCLEDEDVTIYDTLLFAMKNGTLNN